MQIRILPTNVTDSFYLNSWSEDVEAEVNRLGPADLITQSLDPQDAHSQYQDWPSTINVIRWPQGADNYATAIFLLTDDQVAAIATSISDRSAYGVNESVAIWAEMGVGETYPPAGIPAPGTSGVAEDDRVIAIAWKMYPLAPYKVAIESDPHVGLWLCPFVDQRYFARWGQSTTLQTTLPGVALVPMPVLGDHWPFGPSSPDNGLLSDVTSTHPKINTATRIGEAWNIGAGWLGGRIVCRDVASYYSGYSEDLSHSVYGGIVLDLPDEAARDDSVAPLGNEFQTTLITGASGGTFTYSYGGYTTAPLAYTAQASDVRDALNYILGSTGVICTGGPLPGNTVTIEFINSYAGTPIGKLKTNASSLTGTTPAIIQTVTVPGGGSYHSDAIRLGLAALDEGYLISGGIPANAFLQYLNPKSIDVLFPVADPLPPSDHPKYVFYRATPDSILLPVSGNFTVATFGDNYDWQISLFIPEQADFDYDAEDEDDYIDYLTTPPANATTLKLYAAQAAEYYYRWSRFPCRFKFAGIAPVIPNGHSTLIEWSFLKSDFSTTYIATNQRRGNNDEPFENWSVDIPVAAYGVKGIVSVNSGLLTQQYMGLGAKVFSGLMVNALPSDTQFLETMNSVTAGAEKGKLIVQAQQPLATGVALFEVDPKYGVVTIVSGVTDNQTETPRTSSLLITDVLGTYLSREVVYEVRFGNSGLYSSIYLQHIAGGSYSGGTTYWGWYDNSVIATAGYPEIPLIGSAVDYIFYTASSNLGVPTSSVYSSGYDPATGNSLGSHIDNGIQGLTTGAGFKSANTIDCVSGYTCSGFTGVGLPFPVAYEDNFFVGGQFVGGILVGGFKKLPVSYLYGEIPVTSGGTGVAYMVPGQVLVGSGTLPIDSLEYTRTNGEKLEFKLTSDRWLSHEPPGNF